MMMMMMKMVMISTPYTWRDPSVPRILRHSPFAPACMKWHIIESPISSVILIFPIMYLLKVLGALWAPTSSLRPFGPP